MLVKTGRGICAGSIRTEAAVDELVFRREEEEEEGPAGLVPPIFAPESKELVLPYCSWLSLRRADLARLKWEAVEGCLESNSVFA